jgi:hypothetical protein
VSLQGSWCKGLVLLHHICKILLTAQEEIIPDGPEPRLATKQTPQGWTLVQANCNSKHSKQHDYQRTRSSGSGNTTVATVPRDGDILCIARYIGDDPRLMIRYLLLLADLDCDVANLILYSNAARRRRPLLRSQAHSGVHACRSHPVFFFYIQWLM